MSLFEKFKKKSNNSMDTKYTNPGPTNTAHQDDSWITEKMKCPMCGATITVSYKMFYEVTKENQHIKEQLRDPGSDIYKTKCPKCQVDATCEYPMQYVDHIQKLNFYVVPVGHPQEKKFFEMVDQFDCYPGYTTRLVADNHTLADKIRVFDAGLDDRIIEIDKILLWGDICNEKPEYATVKCTDQWYFHVEKKNDQGINHSISYVVEKNGKKELIPFVLTDGYYESTKKVFEPTLSRIKMGKFEEVGRKWAYDVIDQHRKKIGKRK